MHVTPFKGVCAIYFVSTLAMRHPPDDPASSYEIGVDESGRGSIISAVVAGAVVMPPLSMFSGDEPMMAQYLAIKDSKKLTPSKREKLADFIQQHAVAWGVGVIDEAEIDKINILNATYKAMHSAISQCLDKLDCKNTPTQPRGVKLLIDGNRFKPYVRNESQNAAIIPYECIVKGDDKEVCIAAGSILAKTYHDKIIRDLVASDPDTYAKYDLIKNMGYATAKHIDAIKKNGLSAAHRKSYVLKSLTPPDVPDVPT